MQECLIDPELALQIVEDDSNPIAYDTETNGLDITSIVVGYVITNNEYSIYVPVRHGGGGNIPNVNEFETALAAAFRERSRRGYLTVGHNLGFDLRVSLRHGVVLGSPLEDTQINEGMIDDRTIGYGLDDCCARHQVTAKLGTELYIELARRFGGMPDRKSMQHYWKIEGDNPKAVEYATGDGISTLELWASQQKLLDAEELRVPWQQECDLMPYVARAHHRGIKLNEEYAKDVDVTVKERLAEAKRVFSAGFNVRSPKEVESLYRANGYTDTDFDRTEKGKASFTEKWLETNEIGDKILAVRRIEKARDSFITPLVTTYNVKGRIHAVLHQAKSDEYGVAGSRFSCSDPNLQAFPKRNKEVGMLVRPLLCADEGFFLYEADVSQHEPRLFTHFSEEPDLVEGYRNGTVDIHDMASQQLGLPRDTAKRMAMGMLSMMWPKALAGHMRWDIPKAKTMHRAFLGAFPAIKTFQETAVGLFASTGYVKSIMGRIARLSSPKLSYQAVSRIIQNSAGDHLKYMLLRAFRFEDAHPDDIHILLTIHDSIIFQCRKGKEHLVRELIAILEATAQEAPFNFIIPVPFEVGRGDNWGQSSYGEKAGGVTIKDKNRWLTDLEEAA